jgi:DNA recombination protein RmuC
MIAAVDALTSTPLGLAVGLFAGALLAGAALAWLLAKAQAARDAAREAVVDAEREAAELRGRLEGLEAAERETDARRESAERELAVLGERLSERERDLKERTALVEQADKRLKETFEALGSRVLRQNNAQFLELAKQSFEKLLSESQGDAEKRQQAIDSLVKPIREALEKQSKTLQELEVKRETAYTGVQEQLKQVVSAHQRLGDETRKLETALRRPDSRGRWGEVQLRNCVELAGMEEHADFHEQSTAGEGRKRPDLTVRLPGGGTIAVDSKVPLEAYLNSLAPDADKEACLQAHAVALEAHVKGLADRRYWDELEASPEMVVLFVTPESALMAALDRKPDLHEKAMEKRVLVATPTLLVGLLRAVAYGWQQEALARHAREIAEVGRDLYSRLATFAKHLGALGGHVGRSVDAYNKAVGSLERMVLPSARRLKELKATKGDLLEEPEAVTKDVRAIAAPELNAEAAALPATAPRDAD